MRPINFVESSFDPGSRPIKFVELSFDPGSRNFGQSIVSIFNNKDSEKSENYTFEHIKHVDLIGTDGKKSDTEHILNNLNRHLKTNSSISNFVALSKNPKYNIEVGIECQEGVGRGKGSGALAKSLIKMGVISGHVAGYFLEKGIRVKFLPKKSKWNYSEKEQDDGDNITQQKPKGKITKKNHKINTINTIVTILENNNTKTHRAILKWRNKNKTKFVHVADSISGGMERLRHRINEKV
jgi:hypothetical protein